MNIAVNVVLEALVSFECVLWMATGKMPAKYPQVAPWCQLTASIIYDM